jgi:hypothetical protein
MTNFRCGPDGRDPFPRARDIAWPRQWIDAAVHPEPLLSRLRDSLLWLPVFGFLGAHGRNGQRALFVVPGVSAALLETIDGVAASSEEAAAPPRGLPAGWPNWLAELKIIVRSVLCHCGGEWPSPNSCGWLPRPLCAGAFSWDPRRGSPSPPAEVRFPARWSMVKMATRFVRRL